MFMYIFQSGLVDGNFFFGNIISTGGNYFPKFGKNEKNPGKNDIFGTPKNDDAPEMPWKVTMDLKIT